MIHHSQLIGELIAQGRLKVGKGEGAVTFHDPCNLGRVNGVYDAPGRSSRRPRASSWSRCPGAGEKSFCCGGGGANVWYQVPEKRKISTLRAEEAAKTGAKTIAVACPFCITMLEDAAKGVEGGLEVKDIAEIIAERLQG